MKKTPKCAHPKCNRIGSHRHHIIFKSSSKKAILDSSWNTISLCGEHHLHGPDSPHNSRKWREYYYRFLPQDWAERIALSTELRPKNKPYETIRPN